MFEETIDLSVNDKLMASTTVDIYLRYLNEFDLLLKTRESQWEIVGNYNDWDLDAAIPGSSIVNRPLLILSKKAEQ